MSNPDTLKSMRNVGNAYIEMRRKEAELAQAKAQPTEVKVETTHVADVADAKVDTTESTTIKEDVAPSTGGANAFSAGKKLAITKIKSDTAIAKGNLKAKSLMNGDEEEPAKKKGKVTINPELAEDGHTDVASAIRKCKTLAEDATEIMTALEQMNPEEGLPTWLMNALAVSANELNQIRDYIKNPTKE